MDDGLNFINSENLKCKVESNERETKFLEECVLYQEVYNRRENLRFLGIPGGRGVLPYKGYISRCCCEWYDFQAVYSRIGYINQSDWV